MLQPNSADITLAAIVHISTQLGNLSAPQPFVQHDFVVSGSAAIVNGLFFTSLSLILFAAFLAMVIRGWLQDFDRGLRAITIPDIQAKEREKRLQSLERYHITALVALLPILVQLALALFSVGLVLFLLPIYAPIAYVALSVFSVPLVIYTISGIVSLFDPFAPFSSLLTRTLSTFGQLYRTAVLETIERPRSIRGLFDFCFKLSLRTAKISINGFTHEHRQAARLYGERQRRIEYNLAHPHVVERLVDGTVKAPESLVVFLSAFEQSQYPHLRPQACLGWRTIIEYVQPLLGAGAPLPLSAARGIFRVLNYQLRAAQFPPFDGFTQETKLATLVCRRLVSGDARGVDRALVHLLHSRLAGLSIVPSTWHWSRACESIPHLELNDENSENLLWVIEFACRCHFFTSFRRQMGREHAVRQSLHLLRSILLYISKMKPGHPLRRKLGTSALKAVISLARAYIDGAARPQGNEDMTRLYHCIQDHEAHEAVLEDLVALFSASKPTNRKRSILRGFAIPCLLLLDCVTKGQASSRESAIDQLLGVMVNEGHFPIWMAEDMRRSGLWGRNIALWTASLAGLTEAHAVHPSRLIQWTTRLALGRYHLPDGEPPISLLRTFIAMYDERSGHNLDAPALEYITSMVKYSRKKYNIDLSEFVRGIQLRNPWLLLHFDNLLGRPTTLAQGVIEEMKWVSTSASDLIARQRIALYNSMSVPPEPLIRLFINSSSFSVQLLIIIFALRWSRTEQGIGQDNFFGSEECLDMTIHSLITRMAPSGFLARDKDEYARFILDWILIAEDLYPHWSSLPDSWRKSMARALILGKNSLQWFRGVSELCLMHLDARYSGIISQHDAALHSDTSLKGSQSSFVNLRDPSDMVGEQSILLERVAGEMEQKRLRDAAGQLLPFLADAIEEIGTQLTPVDFWSINEGVLSLLRLPGAFGDATCRSRISDTLAAAEQREVESPLKIRRDVPGSVDSLGPRWWIEPSPPLAHVSLLAPSQVGELPDPPEPPIRAASPEPIPANALQIEP